MIIGFSTGVLWDSDISQYSDKTLEYMLDLGCRAIELNLIGSEFDELKKINQCLLSKFEFVSIHAPAGKFIFKNDNATKSVIIKLAELVELLNIHAVVVHPSSVQDWSLLKSAAHIPFHIENMDNRKDEGQTVAEINKLIADTNFNVILDLQHCYSNDPSMHLAKDFLDKIGQRIKYFHISGFQNDYHYPLFKTQQDKILNFVPNNSTVIIESPVSSLTDLDSELQYVVSRIT